MRFGSICSGIEAATVAWKPLGWETAFVAEIEKFPKAVLKQRLPDVPDLGDIMADDFIERAKACGQIDLLAGGTPCQSFSIAGLRKSMTDHRGNLTMRFLEIAHELRPTWIIWENVPGVLNTEDNAFGCFLAGLVGADAPFKSRLESGGWPSAGIVSGPGYGAAWRVLDAQHFGVPQRRKRVWVVGYSGGWRTAAKVLFEREGLRRNPKESKEARQGTAEDPGGRAESSRPISIDRAAFNQGENAQYEPQIDDDGTVPSLVARGPHAVAHDPKDEAEPPVGFNWQNGGGYGNANEGLGITKDGVGPLQKSQTPAVALNEGEPKKETQEPLPFDTAQVTHPENRSNPKHGDPSHPLASEGHPPAIAFSAKDHGGDAGEKAPTLRAGGSDKSHDNSGNWPAIVYENHPQDSRVKECGDTAPTVHSKYGTGGGNIPLVFQSKRYTRDNKTGGELDETCPPLTSESEGGDSEPLILDEYNQSADEKCFPLRTASGDGIPKVMEETKQVQWASGGGKLENDTAQSLRANAEHSYQFLRKGMTVRRLTARECERLQGFPDDWTQIIWVKKVDPKKLAMDFLKYASRRHGVPIERVLAEYKSGEYHKTIEQALLKFMCPDGPRYKALGNSWAVPCASWIGRRIQILEEETK